MKTVRLLLIFAAFLIMIAALFNYYMITIHGDDKYGVFLELFAMGVIAISAGIISYQEKRKNK